MKLYGAYYEQLNEMAKKRAMRNVVNPMDHLDAVEIERFTFMEGAKAAFDLIAEVLHSDEDPNDLDPDIFEDEEDVDELPDDQSFDEFVNDARPKLLN